MRNEVILRSAKFAKVGESPADVALPHTWNALDGQDGGDNYWRGHGIYELDLPAPTAGKRQYIQFEGANHTAAVKCNGRDLGVHRGGFTTFRFDLTESMKQSENKLIVDVDNSSQDVYPQQADFTFFGGLYRNVTFIETDPAHFDLMKDGTCGVFVTPHKTGLTRVDAFPVNAQGCTLVLELLDAEGSVAAKAEIPAQPHTILTPELENPHLWGGIHYPYLYTARASLVRDGETLDTVTVQYGYRSFHVDPQTGFWLNGKSYPLHGVSRHQDRLDMGWAITEKEHSEDMALIREVGANSIRLAHYQHAQYFYDLCDQNGMVVWAEIPFISVYRPGENAYDNTICQLRELIAQNYNHPSICFWGIANEITIGGDSEPLYRNLCDLNALAKRLDPSRLTTMAQLSMVPIGSQHVYLTDVLGYNHYFGWYGGETSENGRWLDDFHEKNPDRPLGLSEYGAEAVLTWHTEKPENHDYTEEYQAQYHHGMLKTFADRPYLWATYVWNMFDFAADARDEGGSRGRNNKGLVTYDRKIKKDSFFLYKAYWTEAPMVHICGRRFVDRAPGQRDITVYTNCDRVTLTVNGRRAGRCKARDHACVFPNVHLKAGENTITASAPGAGEDSIVLCGTDAPNPEYILPSAFSSAGNWFDDDGNRLTLEFPEGRCSIHDRLGELLDHPEAGPVLTRMISGIQETAGMNMDMDGMLRMLRSMRLEDILKMAGSKVPADVCFKLNDILTSFKK